MKKLLIVVGPTASGKTAFSVEAAKILNSEVISADSMQIYRGLNVGTAKATTLEMQGVKHRMLDVVDPSQEFSVAEYKAKATKYVEKLIKDGKTPVICGGTGLYINALIYPLNFSNADKNEEIRTKLKEELQQFGAEYLHARLAALDAVSAAKIHANDVKRVIRALEINLNGGMREENELKKPSYDYLMIGFNPQNRADLYERINRRVDIMFENGMLEEITSLINNGLTFDAQSMQAIGYKEFKPYFSGEADVNYSIKEAIKKDTRNYAKRQLTWFKKYENIHWFEGPCEDALELVKTTFLR